MRTDVAQQRFQPESYQPVVSAMAMNVKSFNALMLRPS
jgi:hypothetical protein